MPQRTGGILPPLSKYYYGPAVSPDRTPVSGELVKSSLRKLEILMCVTSQRRILPGMRKVHNKIHPRCHPVNLPLRRRHLQVPNSPFIMVHRYSKSTCRVRRPQHRQRTRWPPPRTIRTTPGPCQMLAFRPSTALGHKARPLSLKVIRRLGG